MGYILKNDLIVIRILIQVKWLNQMSRTSETRDEWKDRNTE